MNRRETVRRLFAAGLLLATCAAASPALAGSGAPPDTRPAFSLLSSHVATTRERPAISLLFRRVTSLDFRVYRVQDPLKFFAGLRDPHALGSEAPVVPQEQTLLERLAQWKAAWRDEIVSFVRGQFSPRYRRTRREHQARAQIALRRPLDYHQFAQVPLLNASQLVTSWREMLPPVRDTEVRRIPLDLPGEGVYVVEAVSAPFKAYTVVIVSNLGLVTKASPGQLVMFAADRFTGEPAAGCQAEVIANRARVAGGSFDGDGTYEAHLPDTKPEDVIAVARCGRQVAATDPGGWFFQDRARDLVAYVYTDKPIYRPGHTVNLKSVLRWRAGDALAPFDRHQVELSIVDPNDKVVFRQPTTVDEFGSALASFPLPRGAALGYYTIRVTSQDAEGSGNFQVQEYRRPEFEVIVKPGARFAIQGTRAVVDVTARYYFGQPVANAVVKYVVHRQPYYSPLRWSEGEDEEQGGDWWWGGNEERQGTARLDAQGATTLALPLDVESHGHDYSLRIEARVVDASSREVSGSTVVHATRGRFLLAARSDTCAYAPGSSATLSVRAVDYVGEEQAGVPVAVALERVRYREDRSETPEITRIASGAVTTDEHGGAAWTVTLPNEPGGYRLRAEAQSEGRTVSDDVSLWVRGRENAEGAGEEREFELIPDRKSYRPGDVAHLSLRGTTPTTAALLVTKEGRQVSWHTVVRAGTSQVVDVPITDSDLGDIHASVAFLQNDRLFRADKRLAVPATSKQLTVTVAADRPVARPHEPATVTITVRDASGRPVRAQVSLGVIDEAVYGVEQDRTPDPLRFFYRREYSRVGTQFSREYSFVGYSGTQQLLLASRRRPATFADFKADHPTQPQVRKEFPDAIFWKGGIVTDQAGTARVSLVYPDSLTTWRLTARVVTADTLVGTTVARTTVTKDLIARVIAPRSLTEGDEVVVPAIVHNYLPETRQVRVEMTAAGVGAAAAQAPQARTVEIPRDGEHRDDWRFVARHAGSATFTGTATTEADRDAVEVSVPVLPFGLKRQAGAAGSIVGDGDHTVRLTVPASANPAARSIRVSLAPSLAGPLLGALDFLTSYPYGCTEQTLSSFVPNLVVLRALEQLKIAPPERVQALDRQVSEGLQRLYDYQHDDGGWGWWKTDENHPFMTAYAVYGLAEARRAGYKVDAGHMTSGVRALMQLYAAYPKAVPDLQAYMVYALTSAATAGPHAGVPREAEPTARRTLDQLWQKRSRMSAFGQALLALSFTALGDARADEVVRALGSSARQRGDLAWWPLDDDPLLAGQGDASVQATAFAVKALAARDPRSPLLEPAARWLLLNRQYGAWWSSTEQTAIALYGLLDCMRARHEGAGGSSVEVLVNGAPLGTRTFTAASLTSPDPVVLGGPAAGGVNTVTIRKKGAGALYWSATAEYYDAAGKMERTGSRKLALTRQYFSLAPVRKGDRIVYREQPFDGHARPGDLLLVRLDAAGARDWRYLVIEDPLPAGVEAVRQHDLFELERPRAFHDGSRREYRDDRVVFFQESFDSGHYEYVYLLRVTTEGTFRAMPAQISAMYVPDAHASSEPQTLTVGADPGRPAGSRP